MVTAGKNRAVAILLVGLNMLFTAGASAAPEDEVRATFDRFVTAQNAHDVEAVEALWRIPRTFYGLRAARPCGVGRRRSNGCYAL